MQRFNWMLVSKLCHVRSVRKAHAFSRISQASPKVELHIHLDGSIRPATILHYARKRLIQIPANNLGLLKKFVCVDKCNDLSHFLETFNVFMPVVAGSPEAIEQIAYELCEDSAKQGILYSEVRYCPHLLANKFERPAFTARGNLSPTNVIELVNKGFKRAMEDFDITVKSILCCMRHKPEWSDEILELCVRFQNNGVVGIDIAGDELQYARPSHPEHIRVFKMATKYGVHRTVHAGENGHWRNVAEALEEMDAERIGHGYHTVDDKGLYHIALQRNIHFETCPLSSYATGSVSCLPHFHPIARMAHDGGNISISTDDPGILQTILQDDYEFAVNKMGLHWKHIQQANLNAVYASFLDSQSKQQLGRRLIKAYSSIEQAQ